MYSVILNIFFILVSEEETPLCSSSWNSSCCSPAMERRYSAASKKEFQLMLQTSNSFLQSLLSTSATKLRGKYFNSLYMVRFQLEWAIWMWQPNWQSSSPRKAFSSRTNLTDSFMIRDSFLPFNCCCFSSY